MTVQDLRAFGANVDEGLGRCMNNEAFYLRLVKMSLGDANFQKLEDSLRQGNLTEAFEAAHALKGVLGNLSLTPLYTPVSELTELLRSRTEGDYDAYLREILSLRSQLADQAV